MVSTKQPTATPGMSLRGGNRNVKGIPVSPDGRDWRGGLFGCSDDPGTCITATFSPCIIYSKVKHRYEHLDSEGFPDPEHGGGICTQDCMFQALFTWIGLPFIPLMRVRGNIRARYNIRGGCVEDCCIVCWCKPCALTQESRELELEEQSYGGK